MTDNTMQTDWALRATVCELLAFTFRYPTTELAEAIVSGDWVDAATELAEALGIFLPESFADDARAHVGADVDEFMHTLRAEATQLFIGAPDPTVSPFEGVWRAEDDGVQPLLFINPHSMDVERFCKSCGLGQPQGTKEPLDHVATELELLQYLASLEAGIVEPFEGAPVSEALPGGSAAAAFDSFLVSHVFTWMPRFADAVKDKSCVPFFRVAAQLLAVVLTVEDARIQAGVVAATEDAE